MPAFYLWMKQDTEGCDYTIGCGTSMQLLKSQTREEAIAEAIEVLSHRDEGEFNAVHSFAVRPYEDHLIEKCFLLESVGDMMPLIRVNTKLDLEDSEQAERIEKRKALKQQLDAMDEQDRILKEGKWPK